MTLLNCFHLLHLFNALYLDISRTAQCLNISKMELYNYRFWIRLLLDLGRFSNLIIWGQPLIGWFSKRSDFIGQECHLASINLKYHLSKWKSRVIISAMIRIIIWFRSTFWLVHLLILLILWLRSIFMILGNIKILLI